MKKNVLIFGAIIGTILCVNMIVMVNLVCTNPGMETNDYLGYAAMVVVFSLIFFGIRNYRNKELNGMISFGKAFKTGFIITLIASTMYVVVWLVYYYLFMPDFLDHYTQHVLHVASKDGATGAELAAKTEEMREFGEMYENPLFVVLITYFEVLPVGVLVTLISALILKNKKKNVAV